MTDFVAGALLISGALFYLLGSIGLLRLPDTFCRLHALTKADNLGLGLVIAGLALYAADATTALKLFLIWLLVLAASAASSHLIARDVLRQLREGDPP